MSDLGNHFLQMYDAKRFTDAGFRHYELYFPDGSCPPDSLTAKFLDIAEREAGKQCSCAVPFSTASCPVLCMSLTCSRSSREHDV